MQRILTNFTVLSPVSNLRSTSQSRAGVHSSSCSICGFIFLGGVVYSACIKLWGVHKSICLVTCACVDMTPGPSKHKYFIVLYSLFLSLLSFFLFIKNWWWHMHWLFVSLCDFRKSFPNFQSSCIPISPNLQYRCLLWEYLNKKKIEKCTMFLYVCVIMNIYALFFCEKYICMSSLVFPCCFAVFFVDVDSVYSLFEVNKCNSWFIFFALVLHTESFLNVAVLRV